MINYRREAQRIVCQGLRATLADVPYVLNSEIEAGYLDEVLLEQARMLARANTRLRRKSTFVPEADGPWELELPNVGSMRQVRERVAGALEDLCSEAEDMDDELFEELRVICNELRDFRWPL